METFCIFSTYMYSIWPMNLTDTSNIASSIQIYNIKYIHISYTIYMTVIM